MHLIVRIMDEERYEEKLMLRTGRADLRHSYYDIFTILS